MKEIFEVIGLLLQLLATPSGFTVFIIILALFLTYLAYSKYSRFQDYGQPDEKIVIVLPVAILAAIVIFLLMAKCVKK